jgi:hypothetical protein
MGWRARGGVKFLRDAKLEPTLAGVFVRAMDTERRL